MSNTPLDLLGYGPAGTAPARRRLAGACFLLAVATAVAYTLYTGQVWEDFLITFRFSRNLATGHGLVYHHGERVHGFTSPLNVLLPALFHWLLGSTDFMPALWAYRVVSILLYALAGTIVCVLLYDEAPARRWLPAAGFAVWFALDAKTVAFTVNGQEAGFWLFFLAVALVCGYRGVAGHWLATGCAWAGLMWTRPDGCVYIAALAGFGLLTHPSGVRRAECNGLVKAALLCAVLYLPWFAWAWAYYGTPVPHTVLAKTALTPRGELHRVALRVLGKVPGTMSHVFAPIYFAEIQLEGVQSSWPLWVEYLACISGAAPAVLWFLCRRDRLIDFAGRCYLFLLVYLSFAPCFPWYLPPVAMLGLLIIARSVAVLDPAGRRWRPVWLMALAGQALLAVALLQVFLWTSLQIRLHQTVCEWGTRANVGRWLKTHAQPGETIFLECLGYIGYFSDGRMLDWPGLVAPAVSRLPRQGVRFTRAPALLRPDWIVLRSDDEVRAVLNTAELRQQYERIAEFNSLPALDGLGDLPGLRYIVYDARFIVLRKRRAPDLDPGAPGPAAPGASATP